LCQGVGPFRNSKFDWMRPIGRGDVDEVVAVMDPMPSEKRERAGWTNSRAVMSASSSLMLQAGDSTGTDEYLIFLSEFAERAASPQNQGCTKFQGDQQ
jgi:hypothetical protein